MINHYGTNFSAQTNVSEFYELRRLPHSSFFFFSVCFQRIKNHFYEHVIQLTRSLYLQTALRCAIPSSSPKEKCEDVKGGGSSSRNCLFVLINVPASHEGRRTLRKRRTKGLKAISLQHLDAVQKGRLLLVWAREPKPDVNLLWWNPASLSSCPVEGRYCGPMSVSIPVISLFRADNALTPAWTSILWTSMQWEGWTDFLKTAEKSVHFVLGDKIDRGDRIITIEKKTYQLSRL